MIMKKTNVVTLALLLGLSLVASTVNADIELKAKEEIQGTWKLQHTTNSLTDKQTVTREDTWVFKDGKVTILHIPREGKYYDQPPVNYEIEEGKLKISLVGNSRFDVFSLVEKNDQTMTLKGKFGGYYYFNKK
jgi:hypothetical protein